MNQPLPPEMEELHAYVDGQLGPEGRRRVEARMEQDPAARSLVEQYAAMRKGLHALFDPVLKEPVPAKMSRRRLHWRRPLGAIAASVLLLLAGAWIGLQLPTDRLPRLAGEPRLVREAAIAYAVYTPEVRHPVEVPGDQEAHLVAWLTKRMGTKVHAPDLAEFGFQLVGGRLLAGDDGPSALFMYENQDGRRVVLYVSHNPDSDRSTAFRFAQRQQVSVFYWFDGPLSYALAGEMDRQGMLRLATAVYGQIAI